MAFAAVLVTTAAGQAGFDMGGRCCEHGHSRGKALLSWRRPSLISAWPGWPCGKVALGHRAGYGGGPGFCHAPRWGAFTARNMKLSWWRLTVRNWLLGLATLGLGAWEHEFLTSADGLKIAIVLGVDVVALVCIVRLVNVWHGGLATRTQFI